MPLVSEPGNDPAFADEEAAALQEARENLLAAAWERATVGAGRIVTRGGETVSVWQNRAGRVVPSPRNEAEEAELLAEGCSRQVLIERKVSDYLAGKALENVDPATWGRKEAEPALGGATGERHVHLHLEALGLPPGVMAAMERVFRGRAAAALKAAPASSAGEVIDAEPVDDDDA